MHSLRTSLSDEIVEDGDSHQTSDAITRVIIVAVDHSEYAEYALKWTAENYIRPATDLVVLVNVRPHIAAPGPYGSVYDFQEFVMTAEEHQRTESHRLLQDLARYLRHQKVCCKAIALRGDAREELVKKVEELSPDAFIIGSRGLGAVKRTFLGSVSDYCVHNVLTCPVIVVKHPKALKDKDHDFISSSTLAHVPVPPASLH